MTSPRSQGWTPPPRLRPLAPFLVGAVLATGCPSERPPAAEPPPARPPASPEEREAAHATAAAEGEARSGTIYVPAYSSLPTPERGTVPLGILLSIRNVDPDASVTLRYVDYYDTPGHRMRRYLETPRAIGPLGSADFVVPTTDDFGGSGANFLVGYSAARGTHEPLAEAVMGGHAGAGYVSFTSRGVSIEGHEEEARTPPPAPPTPPPAPIEAAPPPPPPPPPPRRQATGSEVHDPWATPRANEGSGR
ncbi:MAG: DUF3124 domain-containing protein [Polyangiales bacterium]